jgi:hypothetical protein
MIDFSSGIVIGVGLIVVSLILFAVGWLVETIRTVLFIIGVVVLLASFGVIYLGKIPFIG